MNKKKQNSILDLIWIIPEIMGELFMVIYIPIMLIKELSVVGFFSFDGLICISITYLLLTKINLNGIKDLFNVNFIKK